MTELLRNMTAIVQYTFVFVLYVHNFKTCTERWYIIVNLVSMYHAQLCDVIAIRFNFHCSDSADKVVQGQGKFEEIVVASNEITASTVQLVSEWVSEWVSVSM